MALFRDVVVLWLVALIVGSVAGLSKFGVDPPTTAQCTAVTNILRFDCYPEDGATEELCNNRGCCWLPPTTAERKDPSLGVVLDIPYCYYPTGYGSYELSDLSDTSAGKSATLKRTVASYIPNDINTIQIDAKFESQTRLHVRAGSTVDMFVLKLYDPANQRWEPPLPQLPQVAGGETNTDYEFVMEESKIGFQVVRKSTKEVLCLHFFLQTTRMVWASTERPSLSTCTGRGSPCGTETKPPQNIPTCTAHIHSTCLWKPRIMPMVSCSSTAMAWDLGAFIFADQFIQMMTYLPSKYIYGLGEHRASFPLSTEWSQFTMWNRDQSPGENTNLYGTHPFYLAMEASGNAHGVFLFNSNAMDVLLNPGPTLTYRTVGGILDMYFLMGPTPADVVKQYTELIGRPFIPPYWGLGFHLCRYGYADLADTKAAMTRTQDAGIPIDTQWNDLDYMENQNDFTYDTDKFAGLPDFNGMHYIPLIDPGVSGSEASGTYPPYDRGVELGVFIKDSSGTPFLGKVWNPVSTVWPDFTHPDSITYWKEMLQSMYDLFEFDGAWIDMNEPANFLDGSTTGCANSTLNSPPYTPAVAGGSLISRTVCMDADQYAGKHYNLHNMYGFTEAIVTSTVLAEIREKRPFVISRSSFVGMGVYSGHWSGDITSSWSDMAWTVPELLSMSLFGIPLMGADICGFNGDTTVPLCQRWMELGAFYPFSRNHNGKGQTAQDPASLGDDVAAASKKALLVRYSLLPYLYTLFYKAHTQGETVVRPIFFEFPSEDSTYRIDTAFMWGPGLLIVPVLQEVGTYEDEVYTLVSFSLQSSQLTGTPTKTGYTGENMNLATITVLGVSSASSVTANGGSATFTYDGTNKVLSITAVIFITNQTTMGFLINCIMVTLAVWVLGATSIPTNTHLSNATLRLGLDPPATEQCTAVENSMRFDCYSETGANEELCHARGCCWIPASLSEHRLGLATPYCFYPANYAGLYGGYTISDVSDTNSGKSATLVRTAASFIGNDVMTVKIDAKYETGNRLHIKVYDPANERWEPPLPVMPTVDNKASDTDYEVVFDETKVGFQVVRSSTSEVIFNTQDLGAFIFADQFIQMMTYLPSKYIYGLGEHRASFPLSTEWSQFTMWNRDQSPGENTNLYGTHPFYLAMEASGNAHGVFLFNSNAMDVLLNPGPTLTYRTVGGILDMYFLMGPTPADVVKQYTELIGRPFIPPYWGLGFHLCRYGYADLADTKAAMTRTQDAGIPIDTQWNDLDYMENQNDFTYDTDKFAGLPDFNGMHYIPLIDPGVSGSEASGTYPPYDRGVELGVFIKDSSGNPFLGKGTAEQPPIFILTHRALTRPNPTLNVSKKRDLQSQGSPIRPVSFLSSFPLFGWNDDPLRITRVNLQIHQPNWYASPTRLRVCHFPASLCVPHGRLYTSNSTKKKPSPFPIFPPLRPHLRLSQSRFPCFCPRIFHCHHCLPLRHYHCHCPRQLSLELPMGGITQDITHQYPLHLLLVRSSYLKRTDTFQHNVFRGTHLTTFTPISFDQFHLP
uniref:P-type domain-containing protein n=1 Tax=Timema cristinae TaxID=61476 RepID=A0A7R9GSS4_TIMCR|nr:unnamed protein product [Timema cristinae]